MNSISSKNCPFSFYTARYYASCPDEPGRFLLHLVKNTRLKLGKTPKELSQYSQNNLYIHFSTGKFSVFWALSDKKSAVALQDLAGGIARVLRQIQHRPRDLLGPAEPAHRDRLLRQGVQGLAAEHLHHIGVDDAGRHAVDADAAGRKLRGQRAAEADDGVRRRPSRRRRRASPRWRRRRSCSRCAHGACAGAPPGRSGRRR